MRLNSPTSRDSEAPAEREAQSKTGMSDLNASAPKKQSLSHGKPR